MENNMAYSPRRVYTDEDINNFIEYAQELGVTRAIRELNYPSWPTAQKWIKDRDVTVPTSITKSLANLNSQTYTLEERLSVANDLVDKYKEALMQDHDPINLKRLTEGYKLAMETYNLILGKATSITQKADAVDESYINLLEQMKQSNELLENN